MIPATYQTILAGDCLFNNLGRNGFKVTTVTDVDLAKCDKYKGAGTRDPFTNDVHKDTTFLPPFNLSTTFLTECI